MSGAPCSSFNPLGELDLVSGDLIEDAGMFADALITHPDRGERHWTELAQALLRALILTVAGDDDPARRNLVAVRKLLMLTDEKILDRQMMHPPSMGKLEAQEALIQILLAEDAKPYGYICAGIAEQLKAMGDNERGSVLSAARTQTQWLDSDKIHPVLGKSDFALADLKRKRTTIYLCLPAARMATHSRWLRLMILLALSVMERTEGKPEAPVLFLLDEFPALGHMQAIETAAGLMAGFGVKLWTVIQNFAQLQQHYDKSWETFLANSGIVTAFGNSDSTTLEILSKRLGRTRVVEATSTGAAGSQLTGGAASFRDERENVALLAEHEIQLAFARQKKRMLLVTMDQEPAVVERLQYYDDPLFANLFDPAPGQG